MLKKTRHLLFPKGELEPAWFAWRRETVFERDRRRLEQTCVGLTVAGTVLTLQVVEVRTRVPPRWLEFLE